MLGISTFGVSYYDSISNRTTDSESSPSFFSEILFQKVLWIPAIYGQGLSNMSIIYELYMKETFANTLLLKGANKRSKESIRIAFLSVLGDIIITYLYKSKLVTS